MSTDNYLGKVEEAVQYKEVSYITVSLPFRSQAKSHLNPVSILCYCSNRCKQFNGTAAVALVADDKVSH